MGGEVVPHPVHDLVDRYSETIHPPEGDHHDDVIDLAWSLGKVAVPGKQVEARPHVLEDKVELALPGHSAFCRVGKRIATHQVARLCDP
jgi:hypothetical protein